MYRGLNVAVAIPAYRAESTVAGVIATLPPFVDHVVAVDDASPDGTGAALDALRDPRLTVIHHDKNRGVGGAMKTAYRRCIELGADVVVKMDADGQMDPGQLTALLDPIIDRGCDYTKGNRFYEIEFLRTMPRLRLFGNSMLSLVSKFASGYWDVMDPTNGYTAIHRCALALLPLDKLDRGYFFESDMLFRLYIIRAVVRDVPMPARYGDESSSLRVSRIAMAFPGKYLGAMIKRLFYAYFLRDFNAGTLQRTSASCANRSPSRMSTIG